MEIPWLVYNSHFQNVAQGPLGLPNTLSGGHMSKIICKITLKTLFAFPTLILSLMYNGIVKSLHDV